MFAIFQKKVSVIYLLLVILLSCAGTYFTTAAIGRTGDTESTVNSAKSNNCTYVVKRMKGYKFIKPIMFVDNECESTDLSNLKDEINNMISNYKNQGTLQTASVYVKDYKNNDWFCINESEKFNPGSMLKVPIMIAFLKMSEKTNGLLDKQLFYDHKFETAKTVTVHSKTLQEGHSYTIRELLNYMITYSDNNATFLLNKNIDGDILKNVFTDFGLEMPGKNANDFPMTTKDYSLFMRALYNSCYLNKENSEFAIDLLTTSVYEDGIAKGIPANVKMAHKFGESGDESATQLHESGIVYLNETPYLITIMTKGSSQPNLSKVLGNISAKVYQTLSSGNM